MVLFWNTYEKIFSIKRNYKFVEEYLNFIDKKESQTLRVKNPRLLINLTTANPFNTGIS